MLPSHFSCQGQTKPVFIFFFFFLSFLNLKKAVHCLWFGQTVVMTVMTAFSKTVEASLLVSAALLSIHPCSGLFWAWWRWGGINKQTNKQQQKKTCELSTLYLRLHLFTKQNYEKQRHRSLDNDTLFAIIQIIYHQHRRTPKTKKERPRETESQRESRTTQLCIKRSRTMSNHVLYERHTDNDLSSTF